MAVKVPAPRYSWTSRQGWPLNQRAQAEKAARQLQAVFDPGDTAVVVQDGMWLRIRSTHRGR